MTSSATEQSSKLAGGTAGERWPRRGEGFPANNVWYCNAPDFVRLLASQNMLWLSDSRLKYLNIRIDTRSGHFVLAVDGFDGPDRIEIERVLEAHAYATKSYGMQQWERSPAVTPDHLDDSSARTEE